MHGQPHIRFTYLELCPSSPKICLHNSLSQNAAGSVSIAKRPSISEGLLSWILVETAKWENNTNDCHTEVYVPLRWSLINIDYRRRINRLTEKRLINIYNKDQSNKNSYWRVYISCSLTGLLVAALQINTHDTTWGESMGRGDTTSAPTRAEESEGRKNERKNTSFKQKKFPTLNSFQIVEKNKRRFNITYDDIFSHTQHTLLGVFIVGQTV